MVYKSPENILSIEIFTDFTPCTKFAYTRQKDILQKYLDKFTDFITD